MKKFYGLHEGFYEGIETRIKLLAEACERRNVEFVRIDSLEFDYTYIPKLSRSDMLYNFARGSQTLESLLINEEVTTFYINNPKIIMLRHPGELSMIHEQHGLAAPRTVFHLTSDRNLLKRYVDCLGGFPLVIKSQNSSRGIGTIKIETWQNLISTADFLVENGGRFGGNPYIMRQFIHAEFGARVMVIGNRVALSKKFLFQENDFRNAPILSKSRYEPIEIDAAAQELCVEATRLANLEMAGVDLLFDKNGTPYLLEINFPTGFQSSSEIPQLLVDYLINKSERRND